MLSWVRGASVGRRLALALALASAAAPLATEAQETSPIADLLNRIANDVNDFDFASAVRRGEESAVLVRSMNRDQQRLYRVVMAAAYYPEDVTFQRPEDAIQQLAELVRMQPDATLPVDFRWRGLDSLLTIARVRTFSAQARPSVENALVGPDGRAFVEVVLSRPARVRLAFASLADGRVVAHDSAGIAPAHRLAFRAHDGREALFANGRYEMIVTVIDGVSGDSIVLRHAALAEGTPPEVAVAAPFDSTALRPEHEKPRRVGTAAKGLLFAALTYGVAAQGRANEPLRSAHPTDVRGIGLSGGMIAATVVAMFIDKGRALPDNIEENRLLRAAYAESVVAAAAETRRRIAEYRVSVRIEPERRP